RPFRALQNKRGAFRCSVLVDHAAAQHGGDDGAMCGQDCLGGREKGIDLAVVVQTAFLGDGAQVQHAGGKAHDVVGLECLQRPPVGIEIRRVDMQGGKEADLVDVV